jgi:hypothetical protein
MEEIKIKEETEKPKGIVGELVELKKFKEEVLNGNIKIKQVKIPKKGRVKGKKLKKGYLGVMRIDENRNATFEKQKILGSAYKDSNGIYHATDGREILFFQGKYPFVIQPSWKTNPMLLNPETDKNETYGDKYKMAKMLADTIKVKSKASGNIIIWILVIGAVLLGINYLMGGNI